MPIPLSAFVAGATGYTGRHVVAELRRRGVRTIAHVRPGSASLAGWRMRFTALGAEVDLTPWEPAAIRETLVRLRPDFVFALLGTTRARAAGEGLADPYERIDYGLTSQLRDGAEAASRGTRFVYLSAMGASEGSGNRYLAVRGRMERELREGSLPWLVAQPAFVTGDDRDDVRIGERVIAVTADAVLAVAAWLGWSGLRDHYASLTGSGLAAGLVALAVGDRHGRAVVDASVLRAAAR